MLDGSGTGTTVKPPIRPGPTPKAEGVGNAPPPIMTVPRLEVPIAPRPFFAAAQSAPAGDCQARTMKFTEVPGRYVFELATPGFSMRPAPAAAVLLRAYAVTSCQFGSSRLAGAAVPTGAKNRPKLKVVEASVLTGMLTGAPGPEPSASNNTSVPDVFAQAISPCPNVALVAPMSSATIRSFFIRMF